MKILKIQIENYKTLRVFEAELGGRNITVAGKVATGKTTAISALWDIVQKVGDPLTHGEKAGSIKVTLGDRNVQVVAERKFTDKVNSVIIMKGEEKISVKDFESWFSKLGENPHKIMAMRPNEQTQLLLQTVKLPEGVNLERLDEKRAEFAEKRLTAHREMEILKGKIADPPPKTEALNVTEFVDKYNKMCSDNKRIEKVTDKIEDNKIEIDRYRTEIESLTQKIIKFKEIVESLTKTNKEQAEYLRTHKIQDTTALKKQIDDIDETNQKALAYKNYLEDKKAYDEAVKIHDKLVTHVKEIDARKKTAMETAEWPVKGLSVQDGEIYFRKCLLSNCGMSEQLLICGALAATVVKDSKIKVVRMDGIESMSPEDFEKLVGIFNRNGVQVLSSRVERADVVEENEIEIVEGEYRG